MGAVSFIETMDHTSLSNITQDEFEKYALKFVISSSRKTVVAGTLKMPSKPLQSRDRNHHLSRRPRLPRAHHHPSSIRTSPRPIAHLPNPSPYHLPHRHSIHQYTQAKNPQRRSPSRASTHGVSSNARETRSQNHLVPSVVYSAMRSMAPKKRSPHHSTHLKRPHNRPQNPPQLIKPCPRLRTNPG